MKWIVYILMLMLLSVSVTAGADWLGLHAYYTLNETSGNAADATGHGYDLTLTGTVASKTGIINNSRGQYPTDNTNYLYEATVLSLDQSTDFSISFWVNRTASIATGQTAVSMGGPSSGDYVVIMGFESNNKMRFKIQKGHISNDGIVDSTSDIPLNNWTHIVGTYNSSDRNMTLYIDGVAETPVTKSSNTYNAADAGFLLGGTLYDGGGNFKVSSAADVVVDEVAYYDTILTQEEVDGLYNSGSGKTFQKTITFDNEIYYDFGEVTNDTAIFATPVGAAGIFNGSVDFEDGDSDYININDADAMGWGTDTTTMGAWINVESVAGTDNIVGGQENGGGGGYWLAIQSGNIELSKIGVAGGTLTHAYTVNTGEWLHIVGKSNATGMYIYINGTQVASNSNTDNLIKSGVTRILIGARSLADASTDQFFDGKIDEVFITQNDLTDAEITSLYESGAPVTPVNETISGLRYYNNMDSTFDWSANTRHGTMNGGDMISAGKLGGSFNFDGSSDTITASSPNIGDKLLTVGGWINPDADGGTEYIFKQIEGGAYSWIITKTSTNNAQFCLYNGASNPCATGTANDVLAGTWNLVTGRYNATHIAVFVNDTEVAATATTIEISSTGGLEHGVYVGNYYDGQADEFFLYNAAKTDAEISELYNSGAGFNPYAPVETVDVNVTFSAYNLTSDGGCTVWNTSKTTPCNTTDTTPTVTVDTSAAASCRISNATNTYTDMGASRDCSTTGSTSHTCTIIAGDALIGGYNDIFISCGGSGVDESGSQTGALNVSVLDDTNATLCTGAQAIFSPDFSNYNFSTGTLTEENVAAQNQTGAGCLFNATNNGAAAGDVQGSLDATNAKYDVKCAGTDSSGSAVNLDTTNTTIVADVAAGASQTIFCWLDYNAADAGYNFQIDIT